MTGSRRRRGGGGSEYRRIDFIIFIVSFPPTEWVARYVLLYRARVCVCVCASVGLLWSCTEETTKKKKNTHKTNPTPNLI